MSVERGVERVVLSPDWQKIAADALRPKLDSMAHIIESEERRQAPPRRTGRLERGMFARLSADGQSIEVGVRRSSAIYGRWVEYGTRHSRSNAFLHRAIQVSLQQFKPN